ncbi:MAG: hypothetical protein NZ519_04235 [Bacteroidia bacterium]|nr:hypothetical protein [Bacteroidia bacterium]MDW8302060.1 hypothetical protein [Bacteroidia bacterium]
MKVLLTSLLLLFYFASIAQQSTTYTVSWKLEHSLPFSPEKYTDVALQINDKQYSVGRIEGRYVPIDTQHPFFSHLPENAFIALKQMTNDTAKVIYACKENGKINVYAYSPQKGLSSAVLLKEILLQDSSNLTAASSNRTSKNIEFTWQFEEFTQNQLDYTNLFVIIKGKQYRIGIYEGKCRMLESNEIKQNHLPSEIYSAVQAKDVIVAVQFAEKECVVYEKKSNQEIKSIKTIPVNHE